MFDQFETALQAHRAVLLVMSKDLEGDQRAIETLQRAETKVRAFDAAVAVADGASPAVSAWLRQNLRSYSDQNTDAGALLWIEDGVLVDSEPAAESLALYDLIVRTRSRWDTKYTPTELVKMTATEPTLLEQFEDALLKWGGILGGTIGAFATGGLLKDYLPIFLGMVLGGAIGGAVTYFAVLAIFMAMNRKRDRSKM